MFKAVLSVRTVLGKVQKLHKEEHHRLQPNKGYDSVRCAQIGGLGICADWTSSQVEAQTPGKPKELIVYNADAIRPAYLIMVK